MELLKLQHFFCGSVNDRVGNIVGKGGNAGY